MKELKKIKADKIDPQDKRFIFMTKQLPSPHELPLFYSHAGTYIPLKKYDVEDEIIDAFVYSADSSYSDIIKELIRERELNVFEQARLMGKLETHEKHIDKNEWSKYFKININKWNEIKAFAVFEESWQKYFLDKKTPVKRMLIFSDPEIRRSLDVLLALNPGINILETIARNLIEVAHRDNMPVSRVWQEHDIQVILNNENLHDSMKLQAIKNKLYSKRYPIIARYRQMMDEHLKTIPRTSGVDLRSDENFETPGMRLSADLRTRKDIEHLQQWLEEQKNELGKIIDIQKGNK